MGKGLRIKVECKPCGVELAELVSDDDVTASGEALTSLMLACHATDPHHSHELQLRIVQPLLADLTLKDERRPLVFECLHRGCTNERKTWTVNVPTFLVGACSVSFHSAHEGHRFRASYAGYAWEAPER